MPTAHTHPTRTGPAAPPDVAHARPGARALLEADTAACSAVRS